MSTDAFEIPKRTVPKIMACRPGELAPLIQVWLDRHPYADHTLLLKKGLRLALKPYAGKKFAKLVEEVAA